MNDLSLEFAATVRKWIAKAKRVSVSTIVCAGESADIPGYFEVSKESALSALSCFNATDQIWCTRIGDSLTIGIH